MKQFLEDHKLKDMTVPTVRLSQHQVQLRRVLVSRAAQKADKKSLTVLGVTKFMKKKTIFAGAAVASILAITVLTFSAVGPAPSVSALQLAQNSSQALANMTPQEAEYNKFYPYFVDWMEKAQHASDLQMLTYDEVVRAYPAEMGQKPSTGEPLRVIDDPSDGSSPNIHTLHYLEFTITYDDDNSTHKIVVGINDNNIPEAAFSHFVSGPMRTIDLPKIGG